jgi:hypothetical protein
MFDRRDMSGWHGDQRAVVEVDDNPGSLRVRTDMFRARYVVSVAATGDDGEGVERAKILEPADLVDDCHVFV